MPEGRSACDTADIESILSKLAADSDRIVLNPADFERLLKQGVAFDQPPRNRAGPKECGREQISARQENLGRPRLSLAPPGRCPPPREQHYHGFFQARQHLLE